MRYARWRVGALLILIAGLALARSPAVKWKRYARLREQIASDPRDEKSIMNAYHKKRRSSRAFAETNAGSMPHISP